MDVGKSGFPNIFPGPNQRSSLFYQCLRTTPDSLLLMLRERRRPLSSLLQGAPSKR